MKEGVFLLVVGGVDTALDEYPGRLVTEFDAVSALARLLSRVSVGMLIGSGALIFLCRPFFPSTSEYGPSDIELLRSMTGEGASEG